MSKPLVSAHGHSRACHIVSKPLFSEHGYSGSHWSLKYGYSRGWHILSKPLVTQHGYSRCHIVSKPLITEHGYSRGRHIVNKSLSMNIYRSYCEQATGY